MNLRGRKGAKSKARLRRNRKSLSQYASRSSQVAVRKSQVAVTVRSTQSQVTQVDAVASQTLTLRGNECLDFIEVQRGLYTEIYNYFPSDSEHVRDILLDFLTSSCLRQTHPCWRAAAIWSATNWDLRLCRQVDF